MRRIPLVCRVCGIEFTAPRFDAKTCTDTCRSRLRRGGDLAYLSGLGKREQRKAREMHAEWDAKIATYRARISVERKERRELRQQKAEQKRQSFLDEISGRIHREQQEEKRRRDKLMGITGFLKLFVMERRNDFSAEAIAAALGSPEHYPVEVVAELLAELKDDGVYDRILADAS